MEQPLVETVLELRNHPNVPIDAAIIDGIKQGNEGAWFWTLPIAKVGGFSQNRKRPYSRAEVEQIVNEVNTKRPEGRVGHPSLKERSDKLPAMQWLGAVLADDGTAWGKAYVYGSASDVQEYLRTKAVANSAVGTSIWGNADTDKDGNWRSINIQAIDLAGHPDGVSVQDLRAVPIQTQETITEDETMDEKFFQELTASRDDYRDKARDAETRIAELTNELQAVKQDKERLAETLGELDAIRIGELSTKAGQLDAVLNAVKSHEALFAEFASDPVALVNELATRLQEANEAVLESRVKELVTELVTLEPMRKHVIKHIALLRRIGEVTNEKTAKAAIEAYVSDEDFAELAGAIVNETSGGHAIVGAAPQGDALSKLGYKSFEETLQELGIQ